MTDRETAKQILRQKWIALRYSPFSSMRRIAIASKRDHNRLCYDYPLIYSKIHGVYVPESEYQPDPVRDVPFAENKITGGRTRTYPVWDGRDLGVD